jgi:hypothetical protein
MRTRVASRKHGDGEPESEELDLADVLEHERPEDHDHDRRGGRDDPCGRGQAVGHRGRRVAGAVVLLADAGEHEHLVVHRQSEHDGEEHEGDERVDRPGLDAEQRVTPSPLEDDDDHAVGGGDREHVHDHGLERDEHRAEHHHEDEERHAEDGGEEQRHAVAEVVGDVDVGGCTAGDVDVESRAASAADRTSSRSCGRDRWSPRPGAPRPG